MLSGSHHEKDDSVQAVIWVRGDVTAHLPCPRLREHEVSTTACEL